MMCRTLTDVLAASVSDPFRIALTHVQRRVRQPRRQTSVPIMATYDRAYPERDIARISVNPFDDFRWFLPASI
jgi:hypothetical protein